MKKIFLIYKRDVKKICSNYVTLIIAFGLAFLPSLYAWVNINASWDPYGNTKGIKVAVTSKDLGIILKEQRINLGDEVIKNLRGNDNIGWQFVEKEEALEGVYSGKYYAAIIIPEDFSDKIGSIIDGKFERPSLEYYVNEKKNAIAPKITDKGATTLQNTINQTFVKVASKAVLTALKLSEKAFQEKGIDPIGDILSLLKETKSNLQNFSVAVKSFEATAEAVSSLVEAGKLLIPNLEGINKNSINQLDNISSSIFVGEALVKQLSNSISSIVDMAEDSTDEIDKDLSRMFSNLSDLGKSSYNQLISVKTKLHNVYNVNYRLYTVLQKLRDTIKALGLRTGVLDKLIEKVNAVNTTITKQENNIQQLADLIRSGSNYPQELLDTIVSDMNYINSEMRSITNTYKTQVVPLLENQVARSFTNIEGIQNLLNQVNSTLPQVVLSMDKTQDAIKSSVEALKNTDILVEKSIKKVDYIVGELESVKEDERFSKLMDIIRANPEVAGEFISSPVVVDTKKIYPIENYGSAMSGFYSILAIWVGALILTAVLKCKIEEDDEIKELKHYEVYLGRYLIFMTLGIFQSLIICLGDLYLLGIQCIEPGKFIMAGIFASIVFTLITYTLTISFGDVGKAMAIIFMILQVAGAGGTFPIEITSKFFMAINPFLPFTFSINAMRECIAGIYKHDYLIDLIKLSAYIPISLIIGLALRKPIMELKEFFEEKVEKTGLM